MSPPPTPSSLHDTHSPLDDSLEIQKEVENIHALIAGMKSGLNGLATSLGGLQGHTMQVAILDGQLGTKQEITDLRNRIQDQDQKHKDGIKEIQGILDDMLQTQAVEEIKKQAEQEVVGQIDSMVQEIVAECLRSHIPQVLQDEVTSSKRELEQVRRELHNSESRRANGNLRSTKQDDPLRTIYMSDGAVSPLYPRDLKGLFGLDAEATKNLMTDYELRSPSDSRDHNLNRLMQFCGVRYQLVE